MTASAALGFFNKNSCAQDEAIIHLAASGSRADHKFDAGRPPTVHPRTTVPHPRLMLTLIEQAVVVVQSMGLMYFPGHVGPCG